MKIFFFHSENSGVGYYRIWQPAYWLQKLGLAEVRRIPDACQELPIDKKDRTEDGSMEEIAEWADMLVFQRRETYIQFALIEAIQYRHKKPCIMEIDDDLINIDRNHPQYNVHRQKDVSEIAQTIKVKIGDLEGYKKKGRVLKVIQHHPYDGFVTLIMIKDWDCGWTSKTSLSNMDAITTTTKELKDVYSKFAKTYILPNCIDFEIWDKLPPVTKKDKIRIGWAGGWQHIKDFEIIYPVIDTILKKYSNAEFHFVRCLTSEMERMTRKYPDQMKYIGMGCNIHQWPATYASWDFDIGIAPLRQSRFNEGKSNLKWLENSARKIPTVATDISCYRDIKNSETGYICKTTEEWIQALSELIEDSDKRVKVGQNAYDYVNEYYNAGINAYKYIGAYEDIMRNFKPKEDKSEQVSEQSECNGIEVVTKHIITSIEDGIKRPYLARR